MMNYSLSTVESSQSGFIRQSFLDNELEHGLRKVENLTKDLTDEVNHALRRISDIMSVPTIRDDEFIYKVRQAMKHKENTIERLQQFDQRQTYTLHTIDQDFTKLKNCVHDIQAMFKSKQIKITTFKMNQLSDIEPYRDIRARLEYEEAVHLIKEKLIDLYHKAIDTNYAELLLDAFHEVFPGFSSKAKVSSTIERNDLSHLPKDVTYKYKDSLELTEEQTKNLQNYLKGIQSGEIEGNMDEDFHVNSDDYAFEHNIFGRPLGGGKPEIDEKLVAGSEFVFDFFLGDVNTVLDSEASFQDRILAGIMIVPAGKVLKLADKIKDLDKIADVGKDVKSGTKGTGALNYKLKPQDLDWRGSGKTYKDALIEAFKRTGLSKDNFKVTKWGKDINGKSIPVEWKSKDGAQVNIDWPHDGYFKDGIWQSGPDAPHIGWQTPGKRNSTVGHIIVDEVPARREPR
ncbi:hypothetical protein CHH83_22940 [Bacillus sp. 7586-K]|nr:hypothetical protein CHH83_22940 [Bacillus sp. 7586-K]